MRALRRVVVTLAPLCVRNRPVSSGGNLLPAPFIARPPAFGHGRWFSSEDAPPSPSPSSTVGSGEMEQLEALKKEVTIKEAQLRELKDSYLLALADMENLRQRTKREVEAASHFAIQRFCKDIISIADVLEMALSASSTGGSGGPGELTNDSLPPAAATTSQTPSPQRQLGDMLTGLQMTLEELHRVFGRHGVTPIVPLHQRFDPNLHNALYEVPTAEAEPGTIVAVQKKGYLLHQRVIRPADVGVARKP